MHAKADEFAHTMTLEMGKRINEARGEVEFSANILPITPRTPSASWRQ
jgi:succinate-semialdehyde dehydrogenase/glutarate-semialdehyde dehydrogenase